MAIKVLPSRAHFHANRARLPLARSFPASFSASIFSQSLSPSLSHFFGNHFLLRQGEKWQQSDFNSFASTFGCAAQIAAASELHAIKLLPSHFSSSAFCLLTGEITNAPQRNIHS